MIKINNIIVTVICLLMPISLITSNITYLVNSDWLYNYNWERNNITNKTQIPEETLNFASQKIKVYFIDSTERLNINITINNIEEPLYSEKEILHMIDVKHLMKSVYFISIFSTIGLLCIIFLILIIMRKESYKILSTSTKYSMILFGSIVLFFLLASSINFSWIFTQFHLLSFSNDLWILDPRKDKLIMMFPQRFFLETTLLIGLFTIVEYLIIWFGFELNYRKKKLRN